MPKCIICKENAAIIPDRNAYSMRPKLCGRCHSHRLVNDLIRITKRHPVSAQEKTDE